MNDEELKKLLNSVSVDAIRSVLVAEVFRDPAIVLNDNIRGEDDTAADLLEVITDLYEMLHYLTYGTTYDYMFHWANKAGGWVETGNFLKHVKSDINELEFLKTRTLPDRIKLAESWIIRLKDSDLEDPDDYDLYNNALSIIIEAIESGRYHIKKGGMKRNVSMRELRTKS